jgi:hypothetical protein
MKLLMILGVGLSITFGQEAKAQAPKDPPSQQRSIIDAKGKKVTVVDFNDAVIEGKAKAPDGFMLQSRRGGGFKTILTLRKNFRPQLNQSASEALSPPALGVP